MKYTVWQCDRCRQQTPQDTPPSGWVEAKVYKPEDDSFGGRKGKKLWCDNCWRSVSSVIPTEKP
jgi:hypothetical protein